MKLRSTGVAAFHEALPACVARTVTVPVVPPSVMAFPETVAGPLTMLKLMGSPLVAVAEMLNGASVVTLFGMEVKVIVWF